MASNHQNVAISFLLSQNTQEQSAINPAFFRPITKSTTKSSKAVKTHSSTKQEVSKPVFNNQAPMYGLVLPAIGTVSAREFLDILSNYNVSWECEDNNQRFTRPIEGISRDRMIQSIAGFMGYDGKRNFGEQLREATDKANKEVYGKPIQHSSRVSNTVKGYVAGMPNYLQRKLLDLRARERIAVENYGQHLKESEDMSRPIQARELSQGLAEVEQDRLRQIQTDISLLLNK